MPGRRGALTSWSPDGRLLAFTGFRDDPLGVWVLDPQLMRAVRVGDKPSGRPAWTPDGSRLTFDTKQENPASIWVVSTEAIRQEVPAGLTAPEFQQYARQLPLRA